MTFAITSVRKKMITHSLIDDLFDAMATALTAELGYTVLFIRPDQVQPKPARVYGTYKVINEQVNSLHTEGQEREENGADPTKADVHYYMQSRATVSINLYGDTVDPDEGDDQETMRALANAVINYFRVNKWATMTVRVLSPAVEDRTSYVEPDYVYQLGFDIRLDVTEKLTYTLEATEKITLKPTADDKPLADIVVNSP